MKILHINTIDSGGAGTAVRRLHLGLKSIGVDSKRLLLHRNKTAQDASNDITEFLPKRSIARRAFDKLRYKFIVSGYDSYKSTCPHGLELFSDDRTIYDISEHPLVKDADLINLHWVSEMINIGEFFSHIKNKPIVWRLSDMNPFTGGCHYSGGCIKYETGCGHCPQLGSNDPNDLSKKIFKRKAGAYKNHNIHVVAISKWQADCAGRSLFKDLKIEIVSNAVPTDIFNKCDKKLSRALLQLPQDRTLILFGSDYISKRKGFEYLLEAITLLQKKSTAYNIALVTFGPRQNIEILSKYGVEFPVYQLGYIYNDALLSAIYSSCDMFVIPSLEEAFGQTCLESMSCGTPPVGFNTGGISDMITSQKTGLLAELKNVEDLADKIEYMITHPEEREFMGENARKYVEREHAITTQAKRYLEIYEKILHK